MSDTSKAGCREVVKGCGCWLALIVIVAIALLIAMGAPAAVDAAFTILH